MEFFLVIVGIIVIVIVKVSIDESDKTKLIERKEKLFNKFNEIENFTATKRVEGEVGGFILLFVFAIDENNEKIAFITESKSIIINFADIIGVEIVEDGNIISQKSTSRTV